jgi:hypothetical protein
MILQAGRQTKCCELMRGQQEVQLPRASDRHTTLKIPGRQAVSHHRLYWTVAVVVAVSIISISSLFDCDEAHAEK